jgi:CBS domain-containing protein
MRNKPVERIMTTPPVVVVPSMSIAGARKLLARNSIHHLPVVEQGRLVGILSAADVAHAAPSATVADAMQAEPISVPSNATLREAAAILATGMFHSLPVIAPGGAVVGIITTSDLITVLLQQLPSSAEEHDSQAQPPVPARFTDSDELARVVSAAEARHLRGDDPDYLAAAVLHLHARTRALESVLRAADLYMHSGQGGHEHGVLVRAITRANEAGRPVMNAGRL